jgi:hypothetical protein
VEWITTNCFRTVLYNMQPPRLPLTGRNAEYETNSLNNATILYDHPSCDDSEVTFKSFVSTNYTNLGTLNRQIHRSFNPGLQPPTESSSPSAKYRLPHFIVCITTSHKQHLTGSIPCHPSRPRYHPPKTNL